ncbi:beta-ketoacyl-[acyl-carrier-protein] synthase family protein [Micromonospora sp. NPDC004704]
MTGVMVTGLGATTPLGGDSHEHWKGLLDGRRAVTALPYDWAQHLTTRIAAELHTDPATHFEARDIRRYDRVEMAALIAAREAWTDAGLDHDPVPSDRLAVCVGTGMGGLTSMLEQSQFLEAGGRRRASPYAITRTMASGPAACVGVALRAQAGVHSVASACATGAEAIALGADLIRLGRADVVVAGGAEAVITGLAISGFSALRALSTRNDDPQGASRPWDAGRDGFVLGEGAAVVVLERASRATARGARAWARLAGVGITSDGYDLVQPRPDGAGVAAAITMAMRDARVPAAEITHVNAHATGTPVGDMIEVAALRRTVGDHPVLTANKSAHGHLLGAAGAVEAVATIRALHAGHVPPTCNLNVPDPALDLDVVTGGPRRLEMPAALKTAFGFGGQNVALIFTQV